MERKVVKIWYDPEGDFLEVIFYRREGYFRETANDQVMEKVDAQGNLLGFSVLAVSSLKQKPLEVSLTLVRCSPARSTTRPMNSYAKVILGHLRG